MGSTVNNEFFDRLEGLWQNKLNGTVNTLIK